MNADGMNAVKNAMKGVFETAFQEFMTELTCESDNVVSDSVVKQVVTREKSAKAIDELSNHDDGDVTNVVTDAIVSRRKFQLLESIEQNEDVKASKEVKKLPEYEAAVKEIENQELEKTADDVTIPYADPIA